MRIKFNSTKSVELNIYAISTFIFLTGIYIFPEMIKYFSIFYVAVVFLSALKSKEKKVLASPTVLMWILYLLIGIIVCLVYRLSKIGDSIEHIVALVIGCLVQNVFYDKETRKKVLKAIFAVSVVAFCGCILQLIAPDLMMKILPVTLGQQKYDLCFSNFLQYNYLVGFSYQTGVTGFYLGVFCGYLLCLSLFGEKKSKLEFVVRWLLFAIGYLFIVFTGKRGELLVVFLVAVILICIRFRKNVSMILSLFCLFVIVAVMLLLFTEFGQKLIERTLSSDPTSGRSKIYSMLIAAFLNKPLFGNGFCSTLDIVTGYTNGHNIYLQVLCENGLVGFVLFFGIIIYNLIIAIQILFKTKNEQQWIKAFCVYVQLHFLIVGLFGNPLYDVYPLVMYMISVGVIQSLRLQERREKRIKYVEQDKKNS